MTASVLLVGAGNLGRRHLQSLANSDLDLQIMVVDPVSDSLEAARAACDEVGGSLPGRFAAEISGSDSVFDMAIVGPAHETLERCCLL